VARLPGLAAPVTVYRDGQGVPQVYARDAGDLFRAQGYVHAQERFWEMDFRRHVTSGRLAELFGKSQVTTDTYLRTLGWRRVAEREWDLVSADTRRYLTAYADGVNAWLSTHDGGRASLEYTILGSQNSGYRIERWDPIDSLAWLKAMAWDLRGNMSTEIDRAALLGAGLSREQIEQLYPAYPFDRSATIVSGGDVVAGAFAASGPSAPVAGAGGGGPAGSGPASAAPPGGGPAPGGGVPGAAPAGDLAKAAPALGRLGRDLAALPELLGTNGNGIGSNSWVLAGSHTTTGKPILANDPHLGPTMPAIWFQIGLHCECGLQVEGYSFSGVPGVVIGHNDRIAWGFTNLDPDVTDLYLEKVDGDRYLVDGQWRDLDKRQETISVAGGEPVTITVRSGKDGPLLSDASAELKGIGATQAAKGTGATPAAADSPYAVALRWTALDPGNGKPQSREEVVAAAMRDAAAELSGRLGDDPAGWRWGALHQITVRNQTFGKSGIAPIEWLFNVGPAPASGGQSIVNATGWDVRAGYEVDWVPSMRMIVDLSNLDGSRWVQLMGQSGHAFSPHYSDQFELWRTGRTLPMRWDRATIAREARHELRLRP
jgi:penicillin amidase